MKQKTYSKHLHVLVTDAEHDFVSKEMNGRISDHIRHMIAAFRSGFDKGLEEKKARFAIVEAEYLSLKRQIEEADAERKKIEDERRTKEKLIEEAHQKLLAELIQAHNRVDDISRPIIKFWSDKCGESVDTLKAWLKEQAVIREGA